MSLSKYESTQGTTHLARIALAILGPCRDVLCDVLAKEISPPDLEKKVKTYVLRKGKPSISEKQKRIVYGKNYSAFDVTLLYFLLRNMCSIPPHKNTWGKDPELTDKSVSANIERIRILRNKWYGHSTCFSLSEPDFERKWNHISQIVKELEGYLGTATKYQDSLIELKTCRMDPDSIQHYMNALKTVEGLQTDVTNLQDTADDTKSMRELPITEPKKSNQIKDSLLKMMPKRILQQILITDARDCFHISLVASDRIWVSDYDNNLLCSNTIGETLCKVIDMCKGLFVGSHTVNTRGDLIYINRNFNIMNLSEDMTINSTLVKRIYPKWRPRCVYSSPFTGDLLVGIYIDGTQTGMVTNYNQLGELTHKIQQDNTGHNLYSDPLYITENNNGDIVVSDSWSAVVVTDRGGRHRFSYTGHPSGSRLQPWGICTDALSHILVCDQMTNSVQLLDRDGQFLSYLLTYSKEIFRPVSLSYDAKTNHIWVGSSSNNKVFVYKYISPKKTHWLSAIVPCATS